MTVINDNSNNGLAVDMIEDNTVNSEAVMSDNNIVEQQEEALVETNLRDQSEVLDNTTNKVIHPKQIQVITTNASGDNIVLFEGISSLTRVQLSAEYGEDIIVYYEQVYTTVTEGETYDEAILSPHNITYKCYTKEAFEQYLKSVDPEKTYDYIAYSHKNLNVQIAKKNATKKVKKEIISKNLEPNFSVYLFTSMNELSANKFPINGLSNKQIEVATEVLQREDYYKYEHVLEEGEDSSVKTQQEVIVFLVGSPNANNNYIKTSNLQFINETDGGEPTLGLIKNNLNAVTGVQVFMLRLNVRLKRNKDVLIQCGYIK